MNLSRQQTQHITRELRRFVVSVPGVVDALVVSPEGLPVAASNGLDRNAIDRMAAVAFGLLALADGATEQLDGGAVREVVVEADQAFLIVTVVAGRFALAALTVGDTDTEQLGVELTSLTKGLSQAIAHGTLSGARG